MGKNKKGIHLKTTQIIALGFLAMIIVGAILLTLPAASVSGESTPFVDALFTATSASCVTGLVTVTTAEHWSYFGQAVILFMIQFGGLGVVSFTTFLLIFLGKRINIKQRLLIQEAYSFDTMTGLVRMVIKMMKGTLIVEGVGAVLYMLVFIPDYGLKGIWMSIFTSISAFCNAGLDLIGGQSLTPYVGNPVINMVTMALIVIGGIGFLVWWDIIGLVKKLRARAMGFKQAVRELSLHTKVVLIFTIGLIVIGAVLVFCIEYTNPKTLGPLGLGSKIWASFFQSVTLRTAGFLTIDQGVLRNGTLLMGILWMFIGGSPGGTAGGVKTMTIALLVVAVVSMLKGREDVEIGGRRISYQLVTKGISVIIIQLGLWIVSTFLVCAVESNFSFIQILYETTSALGTVGLTMGITPSLSVIGKILIALTMYLGRIGPITLAMAFNMANRRKKFHRRMPEGKVIV